MQLRLCFSEGHFASVLLDQPAASRCNGRRRSISTSPPQWTQSRRRVKCATPWACSLRSGQRKMDVSNTALRYRESRLGPFQCPLSSGNVYINGIRHEKLILCNCTLTHRKWSFAFSAAPFPLLGIDTSGGKDPRVGRVYSLPSSVAVCETRSNSCD